MSTEKGVKLDDGKPRLDLVLGGFRSALWGVGLVGTFGAKKYTDNGWQEVDNGIERYLNAMLRHYLNYKSGEEMDQESHLPHLAHMAWNSLAVLELYMKIKNAREKKLDFDSLAGGLYEVDIKNEDEYNFIWGPNIQGLVKTRKPKT